MHQQYKGISFFVTQTKRGEFSSFNAECTIPFVFLER